MVEPGRTADCRLIHFARVTVLVFVAAGCSDATDRPAGVTAQVAAVTAVGATADAQGMPAVYVDRLVQRFGTDRNRLLEGYQEALAACERSGVPTRPLTASEQAKVGTERWQFWRDGERAAWRTEAWSVDAGPVTGTAICQFSLESDGQHGYVDRSRAIVKDLSSGEVTESDGDASLFAGAADAPMAEDLEAVRARGDSGPVRRIVAGQPCDEWRDRYGGTACTWSGGTAWGYGHYPSSRFSSLDGLSLDTIVLEASAAPGKIGDGIETTTFRIGGGLDPAPLQPRTYEESP